MTTIDQPELNFPSAPIEGDTKATVDLVANDWRGDEDWRRFVEAVREVALWDGEVAPDYVREVLTSGMELTIPPRRLSAFYSRAVAQGLLEFSHWGINGDTKGRNAGRPARFYRLRT